MLTQHSLRNATVVITDAASRHGRATAHTFARQGARLVLAARQVETLNELALECKQLGAEVLVVATDATKPDSLQRLRKAAIAFGDRIDVWVDGGGSSAGKPAGLAADAGSSLSGTGAGWLAAALVAGVAGGWFAWRRLNKQDDFSYYVTGGQL